MASPASNELRCAETMTLMSLSLLLAKRNFWLVVQKDRPIEFSFDGEHVVQQNAGQVALALGNAEGVNHVGVLVYLGRPEDTPAALKKQ